MLRVVWVDLGTLEIFREWDLEMGVIENAQVLFLESIGRP